MEVVSKAGINFDLARLWRVESWEESRDLERKLKRRHESPRLSPICQGKPVDALVAMRRGHWQLARLWRVDTWEESHDLEHRLKRWSGSGQFCPICRGLPVDDLVFMRQGHYRFSNCDIQARPRRPMHGINRYF